MAETAAGLNGFQREVWNFVCSCLGVLEFLYIYTPLFVNVSVLSNIRCVRISCEHIASHFLDYQSTPSTLDRKECLHKHTHTHIRTHTHSNMSTPIRFISNISPITYSLFYIQDNAESEDEREQEGERAEDEEREDGDESQEGQVAY